MSVRILCALLICGPIFSNAQEPKSRYIIIDQNKCVEIAKQSKLPNSFCKSGQLPFDQRRFQAIQTESGGGTFYVLASNGNETDELELLCFRCTIKNWQGECGRFTSVRGNESWAKKCPEAP